MAASVRAMTTKSELRWVRLATSILRANTSASSSTCSVRTKLLRFGNTLSSMHTAATPAASYCRTMNATFTLLPNPVSQSAITG